MKLLRSTWHVSLWCTRKGCLLTLWSLWLLMIAAAGLQLYGISAHELAVPGPVRRLIERRLSERGFDFQFTRGTFDFSGRILLENVTLGPNSTPTPLITARWVYLKLDPWDLAIHRLNVQTVRASGVDLHLPAIVSPSGKDETLVNEIDLTVLHHDRQVEITHLTGHVGGLAVSVNGILRFSDTTETPSSPAFIDELVGAYLRSGRQAPALIERLSILESPALDIDLIPSDMHMATVRATLHADRLNLAAFPRLRGASTGALTLSAEMPLDGPRSTLVRANGRIASLNVPDIGSAQDLRFSLVGLLPRPEVPFSPKWCDLQVASVHTRDIDTGPAAITLIPREGDLGADLSVSLAGSAWQASAQLNLAQGGGRMTLDGRIDRPMLSLLGGIVKHDLAALLEPAAPAPLHATASFLPGWKLDQVQGRLHSGPVRVESVKLDETGTEFSYKDGRVLCDNLVLRQGESLAHGLYEMDTATMDFRFLLTGGLRPDGISGWFHEWWTNFWDDFDFSKSVPVADVDVSGRWGNLVATRVFVQADGAATGLRGAPFDHVSTRLFVRPQWDDILYFKVAQGAHEASGTFTRLTDLDKDAWSRMTFDIDSSLSLDTMKQLFGKDASELLAPYRFENAPRLKLAGHVESPAWPDGAHQHIDIDLASAGTAGFHDFPLSNLVFTAQLRDDELTIPSLALHFAGGRATGTAKVWGGDKDRRVVFDATLTNANLGTAIRAFKLASEASARPGEKSINQRLDSGSLNLSLKASGLYSDFYSFQGAGTAEITGADLGQINLFGLLSELLKKTIILDFTSFSIDTLNAQFAVDGPRLRFGSLKLTGPSAAVEAKGDYGLRDQQLDFKAKIFPFDESRSVVASTVSLVLSPVSNALEVKLQGTLTKPSWIFAYGPTSLLRTIIGTGGNSSSQPVSSPSTKTP